MQVYTKNMLQSAYTVGATEIAVRISKNAYESAKYNPDYFEYQEKVFTHRILAEEVLKILKHSFLQVSVTLDYTPEDSSQGMAVYKFDWS